MLKTILKGNFIVTGAQIENQKRYQANNLMMLLGALETLKKAKPKLETERNNWNQ